MNLGIICNFKSIPALSPSLSLAILRGAQKEKSGYNII